MRRSEDWKRVSRSRLCPICDKPDWCAISHDESVVLCQRVESAKRCGDGGWLHRLKPIANDRGNWKHFLWCGDQTEPRPDFAALNTEYRAALTDNHIEDLANQCGLSPDSFLSLQVGWTGWGWSFPMFDAVGKVLGIRVRKPNGAKCSILKSQQGLFIPDSLQNESELSRLIICEGATDTAALTGLGFPAIGRPNCATGVKLIIAFVRLHDVAEVVILSDADDAGRRGAESLSSSLVACVERVRVVEPPPGINDARAWVNNGASNNDIERTIEQATVRRLSIQVSWKKGNSK